jgi:hypothetical protein
LLATGDSSLPSHSPATLSPTAEFLLVAALSLICTVVLFLTTTPFSLDEVAEAPIGDHTYYIRLATDGISACEVAPYCYRVLMPIVAGLLPLSVQISFQLITALCIWLTGVALFYLLKTYSFSTGFCLLGVLLYYSLGWATGFLFFYFWMSDSLGLLLLTLSLLCIRLKKDFLVVVLIVLGVATKEALLFVVPLYYTLNARKVVDIRLAVKTLLIAIPALATLLFIRNINIVTVTNRYDYAEWFQHWATARANGTVGVPLDLAPGVPDSLASAFILGNIATFGLVLFLPFLAVRRNIDPLIRFLPYLVLVNVQLLFAEATERLLIYAFPVVIILALNGLSQVASRFNIGPNYFFPLALALFVLTLSGDGWMWTFLSGQGLIFVAFLASLLLLPVTRPLYRRATNRIT